MRPRKFEVKDIDHDSGRTTYEAFGRVGNKLHRKRFRSYDEATRYVEILEERHKGVINRRNIVSTSLKNGEVSDAENALAMLRKAQPDKTLSWAVNKLVDLYESDVKPIGLEEAKKAFEHAKKKDIGERQMRDYRSILKGLIKLLGPKRRVDSIKYQEIEKYLGTRELNTAKSWNNVVGNLSAIFNWACEPRQSYLLEKDNPMRFIGTRSMKDSEHKREILSFEEAKTLMEFVEGHENGKFVHFFSFCLFAGLRPDSSGEICRFALEMQTTDTGKIVDLQNEVINVSAYVAKENYSRNVTIYEPLLAYLKAYPYKRFPIVPKNSTKAQAVEYIKRKIPELKSILPVKIPHDGLRHTFVSNHIKKSKSLADTALESGNKEEIIRNHYARRVKQEHADKFWAIRPMKKPTK
jgi:hypothetical protein